jgi:hypothetical protein
MLLSYVYLFPEITDPVCHVSASASESYMERCKYNYSQLFDPNSSTLHIFLLSKYNRARDMFGILSSSENATGLAYRLCV